MPSYHVPETFWNQLVNASALHDSVADILIHAQLHGFEVSADGYAGNEAVGSRARQGQFTAAACGLRAGKGHYAPTGDKVRTLDQVQVHTGRLDESPWLPVTHGFAQATGAAMACIATHPPSHWAKGWTPALDVSLSVLPRTASERERNAYLENTRKVVMKEHGPVVKVEGKEVAAMVELLELARTQFGNADELPNPLVPGRLKAMHAPACKTLHRGILTLISPADELVKGAATVEGRKKVAGQRSGSTTRQHTPAIGAELSELLKRMAVTSRRDSPELMAKLGLNDF